MPAPTAADLAAALTAYVDPHAIPDYARTGLQVAGTRPVRRLALAVSANLQSFADAAGWGADGVLVHHGLFWGQPLALRGPHRTRVRTALMADLNLYAAHLPLDAHPEVGNNAMIARALSLGDLQPFGEADGRKIGLAGELPFTQSLQDFADRVQKLTGEICLVHGGGPGEARRVGVISGSASDSIPEAARAGLDTFITGEPKHQAFHDPFEYGVNVIYAGHYETEVFGVRALAAKIEEEFGLPWQFLHLPTGL